MGIEPLYEEFKNAQINQSNKVDFEGIFDKTVTVGKNIDLITNVPNAYNIVTMDGISNYLKTKYKDDAKLIKITTAPIDFFIKKYKALNPSTNGGRVTEVLNALSKFVDFVRNRNIDERLTGAGIPKDGK